MYATFMKLSQEANGGKKVGLIRGSDGRKGSYFYVMFHKIRMELVLMQLVAHPEIKKLKKTTLFGKVHMVFVVVPCFPGRATSHTRYFIKSNPLTCLGLDVPNLQILNMGDMPGISTSSIMPFHNVDPKLVHCLSWAQQNSPRGLIFVD